MRMASSMISLPMYSITMGSKARTRRRPRLVMVSHGLVAQICFRNGGRLRIALKRARSVVFALPAGGACGSGMRGF